MKFWEIGVALIVINSVNFILAYFGEPLTWDFFLGGIVAGVSIVGFSVASSYFSGGAKNG